MKSILLVLMMPLTMLGQKKDTITRYLDKDLKLTDARHSVYEGISMPSGDHYYLIAVYADTTPIIEAFFKDRKLTIKDGPYKVYYPGNKKAEEVYYTDNYLNGVLRSYYENGKLKDSVFIKHNHLSGVYKHFYANGSTATITQYATEPKMGVEENLPIEVSFNNDKKAGPFMRFYENGHMEASGNFDNDVMEGEWNWYDENGIIRSKETYKKGKLASINCFDSTGKLTGDNCSVMVPALSKEHGELHQYIMDHLVWPEAALREKKHGIVQVHIKVNKEGKLDLLEIKSEEPLFKKAVYDYYQF